MRYSKEHSRKTRRDILDAAAREFRTDGVDGASVDRVAEVAGATSGAIYRQFSSKETLFTEVVREGMDRLVNFMSQIESKGNEDWVNDLIRNYVSKKRVENVAGGCILPSLSTDISRIKGEALQVYNEGLDRALEVLTDSRAHHRMDKNEATLLLASMVGSVVLSRSTQSESMRRSLVRSLRAKFGQRE